jgi:hypothetical protein
MELMTLQIISHVDTNELADIANNTIHELQKNDWFRDLYLNSTFDRLIIETNVLTAVVGEVLKSDFTQGLMVQHAIFDQVFIGFKQLVLANTYSLYKDKARNADTIWAILEAYDINLYCLDYKQQIFLCESFLNELDKMDNKAAIASLDGVSDSVVLLKKHKDSLRMLFHESKTDERAKAEGIAASMQKHVVLDIMNKDLLPYLEIMSKAKAETYRTSFKAISDYITELNIRVKSRKICKENKMEVSLQ